MTKTPVHLVLENISSHCHTKWHHCVFEPSKLSTEGCKKWGSLIKLLVPVSHFTIANSHYACIHKQIAMPSGVLKWYGYFTIALFRLVRFRQILSFKLPDLSLPSTSTKLLIQGVASWTGFSTPACNILSTSCLKASFRWTGIGWQGVSFGVTLGSSCIWYGDLGIFQSSQRHWSNCSISAPYL